MITKTAKAKELFSNGKVVEALKIFSTFKVGFTKEEKRTIQIAYESQTGNAGFYQSLGIDTNAMSIRAKEIIQKVYEI